MCWFLAQELALAPTLPLCVRLCQPRKQTKTLNEIVMWLVLPKEMKAEWPLLVHVCAWRKRERLRVCMSVWAGQCLGVQRVYVSVCVRCSQTVNYLQSQTPDASTAVLGRDSAWLCLRQTSLLSFYRFYLYFLFFLPPMQCFCLYAHVLTQSEKEKSREIR